MKDRCGNEQKMKEKEKKRGNKGGEKRHGDRY